MYRLFCLVLSLLLAAVPVAVEATSSRSRLHVGVLLPVAPNRYGFTPLALKALQLAFKHINAHPTILPEHELVLTFNDTKCNTGLAIYQLFQLLEAASEPKVALLGAGCSIVTQPLAEASHIWNIPQFNFISQSPALLRRDRYPRYYPIIPSMNALNPARVAMMQAHEWKHSVILVESSELFDMTAKDLRDVMAEAGLDRPEVILLPEDNDFNDAIERIRDSDVRILFGFFYMRLGRQTICKLYQEGFSAPTHVWIFNDIFSSSQWYLGDDTVDCSDAQMQDAVDGHIAMRFSGLRPDIEQTILIGKNVTEVARQFHEKRNLSSDIPSLKAFGLHSAYGYDAALAVGWLFHTVAKKLKERGDIERLNRFSYDDKIVADLVAETLAGQNFSFEGITGRVQFYNLLSRDQQRREADGYVEINYDRRDYERVFVARYSNAEQQLTSLAPIPWTTLDGLRPVDVRPRTRFYAADGIFIAMTTVTSICIFLSLLLLHFIIRHRKHWSMQSSVPRLNELIVLGCISSYTAVILRGLNGQFYQFSQSSLTYCYLSTVLFVVGFTLCFGCMLVKTVAGLLKHFIRLRVKNLLFVCGVLILGTLLLMDGLLLIVWFSISPWDKGENIITRGSSRVILYSENCTTDVLWPYIVFVYKLIVLVVCIVLTLLHSRVVKHANKTIDSPQIDLIIFVTGFGLFLAAFGYVFVDDPGTQYALVAATVVVLVTFIIVLLFGRKVYIILTGKTDKRRPSRSISVGELSELERRELKELRSKSTEQKNLLVKFVLERASSLSGPLADEVQRVLGYLPGKTTAIHKTNIANQSVSSTTPLTEGTLFSASGAGYPSVDSTTPFTDFLKQESSV